MTPPTARDTASDSARNTALHTTPNPAPPAAGTDSDLPALIDTAPGRYRHYKGGEYEVIDTVRHSETLEPMTLYRALYGAHGLWVRPAAMFGDTIEWNGVTQRRFAKLD